MISISNITDLQKIGNDPGYPLDGDYELTQDIDASATSAWNAGIGWWPIGASQLNVYEGTYVPPPGDEAIPFTGTLDGNGYSITDLYISSLFGGLFECTKNATIRNITLSSLALASGWDSAGLIYSANNTTIENCHIVNSTIGFNQSSSSSDLASFVYTASSTQITGCTVSNVIFQNDSSAGILFFSDGASVINCTVSGCSFSQGYSAGIVNFMVKSPLLETIISGCTVSNCVFHGSNSAGVGCELEMATVLNCAIENLDFKISDTCAGFAVYFGPNSSCSNIGISNIGIGTLTQETGYCAGFAVFIQDNTTVQDVNISGLTILSDDGYCAGFAVFINDQSEIASVAVECTLSGPYCMAGFATFVNSHSKIESCTVNCSITASESYSSGFVVFTDSDGTTSISKCYSTGSVSCGTGDASGFCYYNYGNIVNCYTSVNVTAGGDAGGFVYENKASGHIQNCYFTGGVISDDTASGFCYENSGEIDNCQCSGSVTSNGTSGTFPTATGFCDQNNMGSITNCSTTSSVSGPWAAGFCDTNQIDQSGNQYAYGVISGCSSTGSVTATLKTAAGFCQTNEGLMEKCFATGSVIGYEYAIGFCGSNPGEINNSYSQSDIVSQTDDAYGFYLDNYPYLNDYRETPGGVVKNCYWAGTMSAGQSSFGIAEYNDGSVTSCYWDKGLSGVSASASGTGKTTQDMKRRLTFVGWDFGTVWFINEGMAYPTFEPVDSAKLPKYSGLVLKLLPPGRAWPRDVDTTLHEVAQGIAEECVRFDDFLDNLLLEAQPNTSTELLPEHEADAGLPSALLSIPTSIVERRQQIRTILQARGTPNDQFWLRLAELLGYTIVNIDDETNSSAFLVGGSSVGDPVGGESRWTNTVAFTIDSPQADGAKLEAVFNAVKQAHMTFTYEYTS